ncbi:MAG: acyloxyacyl hydrolase [Piscirickettsiaceae bacterium]|nr:acyloxyacyl hydrolase [Piscirickettsiaceae bacterium]
MENGGGKDLGYGLQFSSGLELSNELNENSHLGLGIYHLSNACTANKNLGEESIIFSYSFAPSRF